MSPKIKRLALGIGDAGTRMGFALTNDASADRPFIVPLPNLDGPETSYKDRDSEGIASTPDKKKPEAVAAPGFDSF